jgi:hypothetical protein
MIRRADHRPLALRAATWAAFVLATVVSAMPAHAGGSCDQPPLTITGPSGQSFRWDPGHG